SGSGSDPNNESVVLRVTVAGVVMLLAGDVEPEAQADLLASGVDLRADVLKVPHHGSAHQDPAFLAAVAPRVALTSVGRDNDYGHPAARTLSQLTGQGARSYRTDQQGAVAVVLRSGQLSVVAQRGGG
ncbi:MAG: comEC, partial [Frankiales bacterium]|nr:comEC [Frankiales bacterium]